MKNINIFGLLNFSMYKGGKSLKGLHERERGREGERERGSRDKTVSIRAREEQERS